MATPEEDAIDTVKATLGEHFQNFAIVVQWDCGEVQYEFNNDNKIVGKALFQESLQLMKDERELENEDIEVIWEDEEEEEGFGGNIYEEE